MITSVVVQNLSATLGESYDGQLRDIVSAWARQAAENFQKSWMILPPALSYIGRDEAPAGASRIILLDDSDQAADLAYHSETPDGFPYSRVFVKTILGAGGTLAKGPNSISAAGSHELGEMLFDPNVNLWADNIDGFSYACETMDPVQNESYDLGGVAVSNFVLRDWFDPTMPQGSKFDFLGSLSLPFTMSPGGYMIRRIAVDTVSSVFGEEFPYWKKAMKEHPAARSFRRRCNFKISEAA